MDTERNDIVPAGWRRFFRWLVYMPLLAVRWDLDTDIWFLLNGGRYVLAHGIPHTEPFTLHEGMHFVMQQWAAGVVFWTVYRTAGRIGLILLVLAVFAAILTVLWKLCMLVSGNPPVSFACTLLPSAVLSLYMVTRPQIFSALLLALELYALEQYFASGRRRWLCLLPALSVLLVNLHASMWPMLFVLLLPYWLDSVPFRLGRLQGQGCGRGALAAATAAAAAAGLLNPYGFEGMTYLLRSYGHPEISLLVNEMEPTTVTSFIGCLLFAVLLAAAAVLCLHRGVMRLRWLLLLLGTAFLMLSSLRSGVFFLLCVPFCLAGYLRDVRPVQTAPAAPRRQRLRRVLAGALCAALAALGVLQATNAPTTPAAADAAAWLLANSDPAQVRLFVGYNDGAYLEYLGFRCYIDARAEVFVRENNGVGDIMEEYVHLRRGQLDTAAFLQKYAFTHLLVTQQEALYYQLPAMPEYQKVYEDDYCALYVRTAAEETK